MQLFVHAGLHKTATTSFQVLCHRNAQLLAEGGVLYTELTPGVPAHHCLPLALIGRDHDTLAQKLAELRESAQVAGCDRVLVSAEDFENALVETHLAGDFESLAYAAGFQSVDWLFVHRDPWRYFNSLYAELSKHGIPVSIRSAGKQVLRFGTLSVASARFQWKFVFDFARHFSHFWANIRGNAHGLTYQAFCQPRLGDPVFQIVFRDTPETWRALAPRMAHPTGKRNASLGGFRVEFNYVANFFMISNKAPSLLFLWAFVPLALMRWLIVAILRRRLARPFRDRFSD